MGNLVQQLEEKQLIQPPSWLGENAAMLGIMGSIAYGVSSDDSDMDIYGFCIPPKADVFPHLRGEILGFGRQTHRFEQYQQHKVLDLLEGVPEGITYEMVLKELEKRSLADLSKYTNKQLLCYKKRFEERKEYDFTIFSIVKYFNLCMENNPNCLDSLFLPQNCILHITSIGNMVRENRHMFLHKGCWHRFKGYSYSQLHKAKAKCESKEMKRLTQFEDTHNIPRETSFQEVESEMKKRGLLAT